MLFYVSSKDCFPHVKLKKLFHQCLGTSSAPICIIDHGEWEIQIITESLIKLSDDLESCVINGYCPVWKVSKITQCSRFSCCKAHHYNGMDCFTFHYENLPMQCTE